MKPSSGLESLRKLESLTHELAEPREYFSGRRPASAWELPSDILCFVRKKASVLNGIGREQRIWQQHHRFVLLVAARGSGHVCLDAETVRLKEGEALLIFPFQFHSYHSVKPEQICWLFCTFVMTPAGIELIKELRNSPRVLGRNETEILRLLVEDWNRNSPIHLIQIQLAALLLRMVDAVPKKAGSSAGSLAASFLAEINLHLLPNLSRPFGIKSLAESLHISESQLRSVFRKTAGTSLGNHIRNLRINRACSLLHQSDLAVGSIAERCGYDSIFSFSRAFRQRTGLSPLHYRKARVAG